MRYFLIVSIFIFSCNNPGTNKTSNTINNSPVTNTRKDSSSNYAYQFPDSILLIKIEDSLLKLPFIKKSNTYIDSFSHRKHGIAFFSDTADNKIIVAAGYNGSERFETYYKFTVDPKTFEIKVMDAATGEYLSIEEYLKSNKE